MTQQTAVARDALLAPAATWASRREARLRPEHAQQYPTVPAGIWEVAAVLVDRIVAARLLGGSNLALHGRVLADEHFEFRGGAPAGSRPRREDR
jgi:hypothetical protein